MERQYNLVADYARWGVREPRLVSLHIRAIREPTRNRWGDFNWAAWESIKHELAEILADTETLKEPGIWPSCLVHLLRDFCEKKDQFYSRQADEKVQCHDYTSTRHLYANTSNQMIQRENTGPDPP